MLINLLISMLLASGAALQPISRLAVIRSAPDFALIDHDAKPVSFSDYKGKVVLVSFIFTTCNGSCPATTHRMAKINELAKAREEAILKKWGEPTTFSLAFLSITLDPERDKPEALRQYVKLFGFETTWEVVKRRYSPTGSGLPYVDYKYDFRWKFVTGEPQAVNKTIADWGMWVKPLENGQLDHPSRIFLVDQRQQIREIYNVDLLRPEEVLDDVKLLLDEASGKK